MSISEDSKESMDRLRRIQKSVLQRRGKARGISSASEDSLSKDVPALDTSKKLVQESTRASKDTHPEACVNTNSSKERDLKSQNRLPPSQDRQERKPQPSHRLSANAFASKQSQLKSQQDVTLATPQKNLVPINFNTHIEVLSNPTGFGSIGNPTVSNIANESAAKRCKLEKRDGSLPVIEGSNRKTLASLATTEPVNVLIPALEEFIAPVPFQKAQWFLPRVNYVESIFPTSRVHEQSAVLEDLNDDCIQILSSLNPQQAL
eukprot:IDg10950t1